MSGEKKPTPETKIEDLRESVNRSLSDNIIFAEPPRPTPKTLQSKAQSTPTSTTAETGSKPRDASET